VILSRGLLLATWIFSLRKWLFRFSTTCSHEIISSEFIFLHHKIWDFAHSISHKIFSSSNKISSCTLNFFNHIDLLRINHHLIFQLLVYFATLEYFLKSWLSHFLIFLNLCIIQNDLFLCALFWCWYWLTLINIEKWWYLWHVILLN